VSIVDFPAASAADSDPSGSSGTAERLIAPPEHRLELEVQSCDGYAIVGVSGELHAGAIGDLDLILETLVRGGRSRILLDLSRLYDLDADALAELTRWQSALATLSGGLWLAAPRPWVRRVLEHMCLRGTFAVYPTVLEALAQITPSAEARDWN